MEKELDKKYSILVVDDEEDICEILKFNLELVGYNVETAASAEEALVKLKDGYHLILLDIMMEGISGLKMVQLLREEYKSDIPVIFLSALDTEADILNGFDRGGDDYIPKPFRPRELVSRIKNVLRLTGNTGKTVKLADALKAGHHLIRLCRPAVCLVIPEVNGSTLQGICDKVRPPAVLTLPILCDGN